MSLLSEVWGSQFNGAALDPKIAALLEQLAGTLGAFEILPMKLTSHDVYACNKSINPHDMFSGMSMKPIYRDLIVNSVNRNTRSTKVTCRVLSNADITQLGLVQNRPIEYFILDFTGSQPPQRKMFCIQPRVDFIQEIQL
jgi:hypothetical protein